MRFGPVFFLLTILGVSGGAFGQQPAKPQVDGETWTIKWSASDEFEGAAPDWNKWIKTGNLPDTSSWEWDNDSNIHLSDGVVRLVLRHNPENRPDHGTYFTSAILKSYRTFEYGFFEARIRGAGFPGSGVCPAFWLFSDFADDVGEGETIYSEVDVVELQQFDWHDGVLDDARTIDLNLHCVIKKQGKRSWQRPKAFPETQLNKWIAPWDPRDDFHVYGCEVGPEEIVWYVDGEEVARKPNVWWHRPKHVAVSLGLRRPFVAFEANRNNPSDPTSNAEAKSRLGDLPTSMLVDYVRVWEKVP